MYDTSNILPFIVTNGQDRNKGEEIPFIGGKFYCKVSAKDTNGNLCIFHSIRYEKGGPALHVHFDQDEWFYVLQGEFTFQIGDNIVHLQQGDSAFAPRNIPHAYAKTGDTDGHLLIALQPAITMEEFYREAARLSKGSLGDYDEAFKALYAKHRMQVVGTPIKIEP